ncbi:hypothetical protein Bca52824_096965 [Brassica carinata]|uniref:Uncharacterized protein n=1 Tax=Brassica carinata TaxID=52824 RepID=A0A8X7TGI8_BRACI|nr:hypothetical protein Bca52824_096965 [Brassica carinata]
MFCLLDTGFGISDNTHYLHSQFPDRLSSSHRQLCQHWRFHIRIPSWICAVIYPTAETGPPPPHKGKLFEDDMRTSTRLKEMFDRPVLRILAGVLISTATATGVAMLTVSCDNIFETDASLYNDFPVEGNYFTGEEFLDPKSNDGLYLETNDLNSTEQDGFNFEDYLTFFDEDDQNLTFDPSQLMGTGDVIPDQEELFQMAETKELEKEEASGGKQVVEEKENDEACWSKQVNADTTEFEPDYKNSVLKKASHMFGAISTPTEFASEILTKDGVVRLQAGQSSGSVHVSMITVSDSNMGWSYSKNGDLSFGMVQENVPGKSENNLTRVMLIFICFWVLVLSVSFKISTLVSSR